MTNQRESGRKAIYHKVGVDNSFSAVLCIGECFFSHGSVYSLKYPSLAVVLVYMRTVQKYCSFCDVQTDMQTFLLGSRVSLLLSVCPCLHFDSDVYPPPHVDNQYNTLSFIHLVAWLGSL